MNPLRKLYDFYRAKTAVETEDRDGELPVEYEALGIGAMTEDPRLSLPGELDEEVDDEM